jgi:hypothetical protein
MAPFMKSWWRVTNPRPWEISSSIYRLLRDWNGREALALPEMLAETERAVVDEVIEALKALVHRSDDKRRMALYQLAMRTPMLYFGDRILDALRRQSSVGPKDLRPHARWLLRHSAHSEPLRLGILLLGMAGTKEDVADLNVLGRHDEFAPLVATAVRNLLGEIAEIR